MANDPVDVRVLPHEVMDDLIWLKRQNVLIGVTLSPPDAFALVAVLHLALQQVEMPSGPAGVARATIDQILDRFPGAPHAVAWMLAALHPDRPTARVDKAREH